MEVYFWSGLRVANDSGVPPTIKVTFPPRPENATAVDAVQEANETFYNILALSVGITGMLLLTLRIYNLPKMCSVLLHLKGQAPKRDSQT